jgi:hypothetical protein
MVRRLEGTHAANASSTARRLEKRYARQLPSRLSAGELAVVTSSDEPHVATKPRHAPDAAYGARGENRPYEELASREVRTDCTLTDSASEQSESARPTGPGNKQPATTEVSI